MNSRDNKKYKGGERSSSGIKRTSRDGDSRTNRDRRPKRPRINKELFKPEKDEADIKVNIEKKGVELTEAVRLNKFIAHAGVCSRREADEFIKNGLVTINGEVITEMGARVNPGDEVKFGGDKLQSERKVYILLNKPKDYVTTMDDPNAKRTVMELIQGACKERVYPVGRLDRNTTGLLLFTNDGELATRLTHPKYLKKKIYHVYLNKPISTSELKMITEGLELKDGSVRADAISFVSENDKKQVGIEIHSGRNRIVRRIFEHLGYKVVKLDRVFFAGLTKKNLPRGKWRFVSGKEVNMLRMGR